MAIRKRNRWRLFGNPYGMRSTRSSSGRTLRSARHRGWSQFWQLSRREKSRLIWRWIGLGLGGIVVFMLLLFAVYAKDLPNPTVLSARQVAQSTKILDRNGILLYEIFQDEKRTVVTADQISKYLKNATVAVEDSDFYKHHGVDVFSIARAVYANTLGKTRFTQGGSTITQQYIKNALLTNEKHLSRKIKEAILALEVETIYDKDQILAGYLNEIPYGNNSFGVESAARTYFNKSALDLTLSESATLAAIPQRPSYFSPYGSHLEELFKRKNYVLDQMVKAGFITDDEAKEAKEAAPKVDQPTFAPRSESIKAPHFVFYVQEQLVDLLGGDQEAEQLIAKGGYVVTTSLDLETQQMAEKAVKDNTGPAFRYNANNAALVAIEPKTGDILSMVGSVDFFNEEFGRVNVATSLRQPGSSFKPIVYSTAFKGRFSPANVLFDLPTDFGGGYQPNNYDGGFRGPVTIRQALSWSLNVPAVKAIELAGLDETIKTAEDLGITSLTHRDQYGLSLALGAGEVKLVELAHAYSVLANQGQKMPLTAILKVVDKNGDSILDITDKERRGEQVIDSQVAYLMSDVMSDLATKSAVFGNSLTIPGHTVASKTGTTQSFKDAWTMGYTPQIAVGVWVGRNDSQEMKRGADGSVVAAPIWRAFLNAFLVDKPDEAFPRPTGIVSETVDKLSTKLPSAGCSAELIADVFASWNKPKDADTVHKLVKIDKVTGKLATDKTPPDLIEERCYRELHSERPDKPNWEAPVQAWAAANGYNSNNPPTEYDDIHTDENRPSVTITSPTTGQGVNRAEVEVKATVSGRYTINQVSFYVGSTEHVKISSSPYTVKLNNLPDGEQTIRVVAKDEFGNTGEASVNVTVNEGGDYPGNVSGVSVNVTGRNVDLSWTGPSDSDLVSVRVYESAKSGELGSLTRTVANAPGARTTTSFNNHSPGTWYYTLRSLDKDGHENPTKAQYIATIP